jgi:hypothetical protein
MLGTLEISGAGDVLEIPHSAELELATGTIALGFNADGLGGRQGILVKDGYGTGDHFAAYLQDDTLVVRFQNGSGSEVLSVGGIEAGRDYVLHVTFGEGTVAALLDGEEVDRADFAGDLSGNTEVMQIGGLGWASRNGEAGFGDPFDGTISDVVVLEGMPGYDAVEAIRTDETALDADSNPDPLLTPVEETAVLASATSSETMTDAEATAPPAPDRIGEVQRLSLDHEKVTLDFQSSYDDPVVFAQVMTANGPQAVAVRLHEVTSDSATLSLQEPDSYDGWHRAEEVTVFVVEAGTHLLADGTRIEADTIETGTLATEGFETVDFGHGFDATPTILSQVQTSNGGDFVVTRHTDADAAGFSVAMQEEEARENSGHVTETVGWLAMERGAGSWSGIAYEAGTTGLKVTDSVTSHAFDAGFVNSPLMLAALASHHGSDTAMARLSEIDAAGFAGFAQEETSRDAETVHVPEALDYLAFEGTGALEGYAHPTAEQIATLGVSLDSDPLIAF